MFEVRDDAGFNANRSCDAIAIDTWPSKGLHLHGMEIKISRSDFLNEIKDPWKAEAFAKYCDKWWFVVAKPEIIKPGELPDGAGLMVPYQNTLKIVHQAVKRPNLEALPRGLLVAMIKRAAAAPLPEDHLLALSARYDQGLLHGKNDASRDLGEYEKLKQKVKIFENSSGLPISYTQNLKELGAAVKFVRDGGMASQLESLRRLQKGLSTIDQALLCTINAIELEKVTR